MATPSGCGSSLLEDLIIEILSRLPVKSLLRLKTVCKKWYTIINSSSFINQHLCHQANKTNLVVCWAGVVHDPQRYVPNTFGKRVFTISLFSGETLENHVKLDNGIFTGAIHCVCGPCDGIICVHFTDSTLALWNPASRKLWPIPCYSATSYERGIFSFWIEPLTYNFKIFLIISESWSEGIYHKPRFVLYTSCNDSWRSFEAEEAPFCRVDAVPLNQCSRYSVSNGYYYFLKENKMTSTYALMAFDIRNELFQEIQMPEINKSSNRTIKLDLYRGFLALFSSKPEAGFGCYGIWVLKKKGWTELGIVELPTIFDNPIGFWGRSELIMLSFNQSHNEKELMIYSPLSDEARKVEVETPVDASISEFASSSEFFPLCYRESLISLKR